MVTSKEGFLWIPVKEENRNTTFITQHSKSTVKRHSPSNDNKCSTGSCIIHAHNSRKIFIFRYASSKRLSAGLSSYARCTGAFVHIVFQIKNVLIMRESIVKLLHCCRFFLHISSAQRANILSCITLYYASTKENKNNCSVCIIYDSSSLFVINIINKFSISIQFSTSVNYPTEMVKINGTVGRSRSTRITRVNPCKYLMDLCK